MFLNVDKANTNNITWIIAIITVDGKKSSPSIPEITYIIIVVIIKGSLIFSLNEIIILNRAAITTAVRYGYKENIIIPTPLPVLELELDDSNIVNSQPIYSKVIPRDILVKTRGKVFFLF